MHKYRRHAIVVIALLITAGCAARKPRTAVHLPPFELHSSINTTDGIDMREAGLIAGQYMARYVNLCGMPDYPVLKEDFWVTKVWVGFVPCYAGEFRISRTTGDVIALTERERPSADEHGR